MNSIKNHQKWVKENNKKNPAAVESHRKWLKAIMLGKEKEWEEGFQEKEWINWVDHKHETALMCAARKGNEEWVEALIENGADLHMKNEKGQDALMIAAMEGREEVLKTLLRHKADVLAKDHDDQNALMHCLNSLEDFVWGWGEKKRRIENMAELLIQAGCDLEASLNQESILERVVRLGHVRLLKSMIQQGVNSHKKNENKETALIQVVKTPAMEDVLIQETLEMMKELLKAGLHVNEEDDQGNTALFFAIKSHEKEWVELLLKNGADWRHVNKKGQTPKSLALRHDNILELLERWEEMDQLTAVMEKSNEKTDLEKEKRLRL